MTTPLDTAQFFDFTPQLCCVASLDGVFLRVNKAWQETLGYAPAELEGMPFLNFVHPDDRAKTETVMARELMTHVPLSGFENRYRHKDGSWRWLHWSAVHRAGQNLIYAAADDVTARKQLEQNLQEVQVRYERTVIGSNDGLWEWDIDTDQFWLSPRGASLIGVAENTPLSAAQLRAFLYLDDQTVFEAGWAAQLQRKIPLNVEFRLQQAPGQFRWLRMRGRLFDRNGVATYLAGSIADIHDEKLTELELKFTQELLTESQELARLGSWQYDVEARHMFWSREVYGIFGRDPALGPPQGEERNKYFYPEDAARLQEAMTRAIENGESYKIELRGRREDGRDISVRSLGRPLTDPDGAIALIMGTLQDVTDWHQLESARANAELANQMKSQFLTNISHEIRTPMNAILGMTQMLMHGNLSQQQQEQCRIIMTGAKDLLTIINDLLDLAKAESGQMSLEDITFDLYDMLREVVSLHSARIYEKNLEMVVSIAPTVPRTVNGDPLRMKQIIGNLIGNAAKFTKAGHIMLTVSDQGEAGGQHILKFAIADTGIGIPAEKLPFVFDKFIQANAATAREYGGTGLGLSICRELVELMGGTINVASETGGGTVFSFEIPMPVQPVTVPDLSKIHALIYEPYAPARTALAQFFKACQATVSWAMTPADLTAHNYEATAVTHILLAEEPQGRNALEIAQNITTPHSPIIIMAKPSSQLGNLPPEMTLLSKPCFPHELVYALSQTPLTMPPAAAEKLIAAKAPDPMHNIDAVRVLLVEDNRMNQTVFRRVFELLGCRLMVADNGQAALDVVHEDDFDIILMDVQMPVMDGFEATRALGVLMDAGALKPIPIVGLTGNAEAADRAACLAAGMVDVLIKPVMLDDLTAVLQKYAARYAKNPGS